MCVAPWNSSFIHWHLTNWATAHSIYERTSYISLFCSFIHPFMFVTWIFHTHLSHLLWFTTFDSLLLITDRKVTYHHHLLTSSVPLSIPLHVWLGKDKLLMSIIWYILLSPYPSSYQSPNMFCPLTLLYFMSVKLLPAAQPRILGT